MMNVMDVASEAVSAAVRAEVARARLSGRKAAAAIDMPYSNWQRRMRTHRWTITELARIARALDIPLSRLTGEE